jgi:hypothetical protein
MGEEDITKEERILRMMKKVLTDVARDTYTRPGFRHPLSETTIHGISECLALISARERELSEAQGRPSMARPRFIDEPKKKFKIPLKEIGGRKKPGDD